MSIEAASPLCLPTVSIDLVAVSEARCWACARLYAEGELHLRAIEKLQCDAERDGLVAAIGQDRIQEMMAEALAKVGTLTAWDLGEAFADHRGVLAGATFAELDLLIGENDPTKFREWMARLSVAERQAVRDLLVSR